ncbi:MAG TPA: hypothetical protein VF624_18805 [Tepidisphaeraceae bacterium]|jgi:hypothetical protein
MSDVFTELDDYETQATQALRTAYYAVLARINPAAPSDADKEELATLISQLGITPAKAADDRRELLAVRDKLAYLEQWSTIDQQRADARADEATKLAAWENSKQVFRVAWVNARRVADELDTVRNQVLATVPAVAKVAATNPALHAAAVSMIEDA